MGPGGPSPSLKKHLPSEMQGDAGIASSASSTFGDSELPFFGLFSWIFLKE